MRKTANRFLHTDEQCEIRRFSVGNPSVGGSHE